VLDNLGSIIPPPTYTRLPRFTFDLSPIVIDPTILLTFKTGVNVVYIYKRLKQSTILDKGQYEALLTALSCEFALI
jgi:hypothetical protein